MYRAEQYLAWKTGLSLTRAKQIVTIARRAAELPVSIDAFRHGELAVDQVYAIALRAPWWADREVCELARYPFPEIPNPNATPEPQTQPQPAPPHNPNRNHNPSLYRRTHRLSQLPHYLSIGSGSGSVTTDDSDSTSTATNSPG